MTASSSDVNNSRAAMHIFTRRTARIVCAEEDGRLRRCCWWASVALPMECCRPNQVRGWIEKESCPISRDHVADFGDSPSPVPIPVAVAEEAFKERAKSRIEAYPV